MREVVLDTETTGLSPDRGDRVVEIGCVELVNFIPTGSTFQTYLDPEMPMPAEALRIHGLTDDLLRGQPKFAEIADTFLDFIRDATVIAHNADFDIKFLNAELGLAERPPIASKILDSVRLARRKYPGAQVSLDALCRRFEIDTADRTKHGALLDAQLLAQVYLELVGGRQPGLTLTSAQAAKERPAEREVRPARAHGPSAAEREAHEAFLKSLNEPVWLW